MKEFNVGDLYTAVITGTRLIITGVEDNLVYLTIQTDYSKTLLIQKHEFRQYIRDGVFVRINEDSLKVPHTHKPKKYIGFTEVFMYCEYCNEKL